MSFENPMFSQGQIQQPQNQVSVGQPPQMAPHQAQALQILMEKERQVNAKIQELKERESRLQAQPQPQVPPQQPHAPQPNPLEAQIAKLYEMVENLTKATTPLVKQQEVTSLADQFQEWFKGQKEDVYPTFRKVGVPAKEVIEYMELVESRTGKRPSWEEASNEIEKFYSGIAEKLGVNGQSQAPNSKLTPEQYKALVEPVSGPTSLDNSMTSVRARDALQGVDPTDPAALVEAQRKAFYGR